jgi:hypothetical protein
LSLLLCVKLLEVSSSFLVSVALLKLKENILIEYIIKNGQN